jgi:hypothetical protein
MAMTRLLTLIVILSVFIAVGMAMAAQLSASVRHALRRANRRHLALREPPRRPPVEAGPSSLGRGLWRKVFADCAADVTRFERVTGTVEEPAVRRWLDELVPELRERLQRVRRLAELGQTLAPDPRSERDITNETACRVWHACVNAWGHFSRMADKSGAVAYDLLGTPDVASVERQLRAIEEVVRDLRRATEDPAD